MCAVGGRGRHVGTTTTEEHKSALRRSVNGDSKCVRTRVHEREQAELVGKGLINYQTHAEDTRIGNIRRETLCF